MFCFSLVHPFVFPPEDYSLELSAELSTKALERRESRDGRDKRGWWVWNSHTESRASMQGTLYEALVPRDVVSDVQASILD